VTKANRKSKTAKLAPAAPAPKAAKVAARPPKPKPELPCVCGCGETTRALFVQGHDARVKGSLLRVARGVPLEGERSKIGTLLQRCTKDERTKRALNSAAFVPLCEAAIEQLRKPRAS
jgi:hypothetical protein